MFVFVLPLRSIFAPDVVEALEAHVADAVRDALARRDGMAGEWMTTSQMAERLEISEEAVRKRARRGRLESQHQGRRLLVRLRDGR